MARLKLTRRSIDAIELPIGKRLYIYDTELTGFGLAVTPAGSMSFFVEYRNGPGRGARTKRITIGSTAKVTPDEARAVAKQHLAAVVQGEDPAGDRKTRRDAVTVSELAKLFLEKHVEAKRKPRTHALYRLAIDSYISPALGQMRAIDVSRADVIAMHGGQRGAPVMANRALNVLSALYTWAAKSAIVPEGLNPTKGVERYREQERERFLTADELGRLGAALDEAETVGIEWVIDPERASRPTAKHTPNKAENRRTNIGPHAAAAIRLLILTGCRLNEILGLRWAEIDFDRGLLLLPDSKTGKKAVILNAAALDILRTVPRSGVYVIASDSAGQKDEQPRHDLKRPWDLVRTRAGLDGVRLHDLRHTHASIGAGAGLGLPIIGKLLGHKHARTTQRYAHLDTDPLRRASDQIGETIVGAMRKGA